jgi:hypothetical protein
MNSGSRDLLINTVHPNSLVPDGWLWNEAKNKDRNTNSSNTYMLHRTPDPTMSAFGALW